MPTLNGQTGKDVRKDSMISGQMLFSLARLNPEKPAPIRPRFGRTPFHLLIKPIPLYSTHGNLETNLEILDIPLVIADSVDRCRLAYQSDLVSPV
ncbi:hypothetical protein [Dyadobacter flavalbus]|nr:hypothetical protein [Dyadobacter flavalbus]